MSALLLASLLLACTPGPGETGDTGVPLEPLDAEVANRLDLALDSILEEHPAVGIEASVVLPGHEPWAGASGLADYDAQTELTADHLSKAGSVTKVITATLVLQAVEAGVLSLDDSLTTWLPDQPWGEELTLRHLLQHSSGVPEYAGQLELDGEQGQATTLAELVARVEGEPLQFEPGTSFSYTNTNYVLLGLVLEEAMGRPWSEQAQALLDEVEGGQLLVPATGAGWGAVVPGYCVLPSGEPYELAGTTDLTDYWNADAISPAGSLAADVRGLAALGSALWVEQSLLSEASVQSMVQDTVQLSPTMDYGLGVVVEGDRWFHNGAVTGYAAWLEVRSTDGAVITLESNSWLVKDSSFSSDWMWEARDALWTALDG